MVLFSPSQRCLIIAATLYPASALLVLLSASAALIHSFIHISIFSLFAIHYYALQ